MMASIDLTSSGLGVGTFDSNSAAEIIGNDGGICEGCAVSAF
jgi:hypothetical protein